MSKSKVQMPKDIESKCRMTIHTAAVATGSAGAVPIPISDTIPISAIQVGMIVKLGRIFDVSLSEATAKSIANVALVQHIGRSVARNLIKKVPGVGWVISAATAATLTETLGWVIADDFYRMSIGERPVELAESMESLESLFSGYRTHK